MVMRKTDSIGDVWELCEKHNQWFLVLGGYCSKCHPRLDFWANIIAKVVAVGIITVLVIFLIVVWMLVI